MGHGDPFQLATGRDRREGKRDAKPQYEVERKFSSLHGARFGIGGVQDKNQGSSHIPAAIPSTADGKLTHYPGQTSPGALKQPYVVNPLGSGTNYMARQTSNVF